MLVTVLLDETVAIREILFQQLNVRRTPVLRFVVHFKCLEVLLNRMEEITNCYVRFRPSKLSLRPFLNVESVIAGLLSRAAMTQVRRHFAEKNPVRYRSTT